MLANSNRAAASRKKRGSLLRLHSTSKRATPAVVRTAISASQPRSSCASTFTLECRFVQWNSLVHRAVNLPFGVNMTSRIANKIPCFIGHSQNGHSLAELSLDTHPSAMYYSYMNEKIALSL